MTLINLFAGYQVFEPGQLVSLTEKNKIGKILKRCGGGQYDVMVLGNNNLPTGERWIISSKWLKPNSTD